MGIFRVLVVLLIITLVAPDSMAVVRRQKNKLTKADYENMYLTFDMGGGLYTYRYKVDGKKQNVKPGGTMNICFNQFFPKGFGYGVGLGASYYGAATTFSALETVEVTDYDVHKYDPDFMTGEPETYTFKTQFNNISERQHLVQFEVPVILDVTHSLQQPNQSSGVTGGKPELIGLIAKAGIAAGADGIFMEVHPEPEKAKSDGANMLRLDLAQKLLQQLVRIKEAL